jgi:hypothetical protein
MATVCARRGEQQMAEEFLVEALCNRESVYGREHPELLLTLRRYSEWLKAQGRAEDAAALESRLELVRLISSACV